MNSIAKILLALVLLITAIAFIINSSIFKSFRVDVVLADVECVSGDQVKKTLNLAGETLLSFDRKKLENLLKEKYLCIDKLNLSLKFPPRVVAEIKGRTAKVQLKKIDLINIDASSSSMSSRIEESFIESTDSAFFLADESGFIFKKVEGQVELPLIEAVQELDLKGNILDGGVGKTLYILEKLRNLELYPESVRLSDQALFMEGRPVLKFTLKNDLDRQVASLQLILQKDRMRLSLFPKEMKLSFSPEEMRQSLLLSEVDSAELKSSKNIEMIDLRFDKPVVKYTPKKN